MIGIAWKSINQFGEYWHNNIRSSYLWYLYIFGSSLTSINNVLSFSVYRFCTYFVKSNTNYFKFPDALVSGIVLTCGGPTESGIYPLPPIICLNVGTDGTTHVPRGYEKVYYSHNGAFWIEQGRHPSQSGIAWVTERGSGPGEWDQGEDSYIWVGFAWFELTNWHLRQKFRAFLLTCSDVGQEGGVELESCQWPNIKNGLKLFTTFKISVGH